MRFQGETPRRFIWQRLDHIELALVALHREIEKMAQQTAVRQHEFEQLKYQVAAFSEGMNELERRVGVLERRNSSEQWIIRQIGTIALVVLGAYIASWFW